MLNMSTRRFPSHLKSWTSKAPRPWVDFQEPRPKAHWLASTQSPAGFGGRLASHRLKTIQNPFKFRVLSLCPCLWQSQTERIGLVASSFRRFLHTSATRRALSRKSLRSTAGHSSPAACHALSSESGPKHAKTPASRSSPVSFDLK